MFDIGWSELLVIAVVAIVVVGPKDLPRLMRSFGRYAGKLRRMASDFQKQFDQAISDGEFEELQQTYRSAMHARERMNEPVMLPKPKPDEASDPAAPVRRPLPKRASGAKRGSRATPAKAKPAKAKPAPAAKAKSSKTAPAAAKAASPGGRAKRAGGRRRAGKSPPRGSSA
jgi:sec-independent protein translocase protein TatB